MRDFITTYSKTKFNPIEPNQDGILIDDIAHALSLMCRANGHFAEFYSVGQHSVFCCEEAIERGYTSTVALACLLHDASEAYLADITRPVKKNLDQYLVIEDKLQSTIYEKFIGRKLNKEEEEQISSVDDAMLYNEFIHYMNMELPTKETKLVRSPKFKFQEFSEVRDRYKELFNMLMEKCNLEKEASMATE